MVHVLLLTLCSSDITGIVFGSIAAIFLATGAVLMLFIVYRRYEHKVFKIVCASHSDVFFPTSFASTHRGHNLLPCIATKDER